MPFDIEILCVHALCTNIYIYIQEEFIICEQKKSVGIVGEQFNSLMYAYGIEYSGV